MAQDRTAGRRNSVCLRTAVGGTGSGCAHEPIGPDWSIAENQPCQVWNYGYRSLEPFTWSGACVHGKASGEGRLTINDGRTVYEGDVLAGKIHGYGTAVYVSGDRYTGEFRDGQPEGYGTRFMAKRRSL